MKSQAMIIPLLKRPVSQEVWEGKKDKRLRIRFLTVRRMALLVSKAMMTRIFGLRKKTM